MPKELMNVAVYVALAIVVIGIAGALLLIRTKRARMNAKKGEERREQI